MHTLSDAFPYFIHTYTDLLFINATSAIEVIGEGGTAQLTVTASGINSRNFTYKWEKKRGQFSDRVGGINTTTLTIHNVLDSDEGHYYCTATNEWGNSLKTGDITLTVEGNYMHVKERV